jgi:predicted DNA-binding transcriptional regulator AlpA
MPEPVIYHGAAELAALFGVKPGTIDTWRKRYPDFPEPDAFTGRVAGWLPSREAEMRAWRASRPGRGAGGGRPRRVS